MPAPTTRRVVLNPDRELDRILTLDEAAELSSLSPDTIKRHHSQKLIRLSPRRIGIRLRDALALSQPLAAA